MDTLARRVHARWVEIKTASSVSVRVDIPATIAAKKRWPMFEGLLVGTFESQIALYRIFDGEELNRILASGKITGGNYAVKAERSLGASWAHDISAVIRFGNSARGKRLGKELYLAKIDGADHQFLHLGPEGVSLDLQAEEQIVKIPKQTCNLGLGCSVADISVHDVDDWYKVLPNDQISKLSLSELKSEVKTASATTVLKRYASYFEPGTIVLYGKYKNKRGKVVRFAEDKWGNPTVEIEPIPKGRKENKVLGLYKIWRADVKESTE